MEIQKLESGDIVMCTVEKILGTTILVNIDGIGEGSIILSEIAPGRIRNLRDYVVPKKRIACKVLRVSGDRIELSLRRVTPKEQKEVKDVYEQEKSCRSVLKSVLGEESDSIIKEIQKKETLLEFCERAKENLAELEKFAGKERAKKIQDILKIQKKKKIVIKKEFSLTSKASNGIELIKKILERAQGLNMKYLSAGKYTIKTESVDPRKSESDIRELLDDIEAQAKIHHLSFSIKEK